MGTMRRDIHSCLVPMQRLISMNLSPIDGRQNGKLLAPKTVTLSVGLAMATFGLYLAAVEGAVFVEKLSIRVPRESIAGRNLRTPAT
jgi:hypothetical protein